MAISGIGAIGAAALKGPAAPKAPGGGGGGFGGVLENAIGKLDATQTQASTAAQQIATGQSTDISTVAMQIEQASLSLQLAAQVRDKLVGAYDQLFQMQI